MSFSSHKIFLPGSAGEDCAQSHLCQRRLQSLQMSDTSFREWAGACGPKSKMDWCCSRTSVSPQLVGVIRVGVEPLRTVVGISGIWLFWLLCICCVSSPARAFELVQSPSLSSDASDSFGEVEKMMLTAVDLSAEIFQMNSIADKGLWNAASLSGRPVPTPAGCWFFVFRREPNVNFRRSQGRRGWRSYGQVTVTLPNGTERREGGKGGCSNEGGGEGLVLEGRRKGHC